MKRSGFKRGRPWKDRHEVKRKTKPLVPKALGKMLVDKGPIRDRAHRVRIAELPCLICGLTGSTQSHHIRECLPRTIGVRVGDDHLVPLCVTHHMELHAVNNASFWQHYHLDAVARAAELYRETLSYRRITEEKRT